MTFRVFDDFLPDSAAVRAHALASEFVDWPGYDGEVYRRVCLTEVPGLQDRIEQVMGPVEMLGMGYRLNFGGELPNAAIHSDLGWGTHALVLYLSEGEGGTAFWRHKATGANRIDPGDMALFEAVRHDWDDAERWEQLALAEMKMGRAVIYESALFHSRWPFAAFGMDANDGRLIAVAFFTPKDRECRSETPH
jgi:hypothetical protein